MDFGAIAGVAAAAIGQLINMGMQAEAQNLRQQIADQYGSSILPDLDKLTAQQIDSTAFSGIKEDSSLRDTQVNALNQLMDVYSTGGTTSADRAALELANDTVNRNAQGAQFAAQNNAAERGISQSPAGMALAQSNAQDRLSTLGGMARQNQQDARQRALQALMQGANLAGNVRDTDYQHAANLAQAQDALNQFNSSARERAANANNQLALDQYNANMQRLAARSNAINGVASGYENIGRQAANIGGGVGQAAISFGTRKKKDGEE